MFPTGPTSAPMGLSARGSSLRILPRGYLARGRLAFSFQSSAANSRAAAYARTARTARRDSTVGPDWLVGINGTRAMTAFNSKTGGFHLTTVGRVQTPTLAIVVEREERIKKFVAKDYWEVHGTFAAAAGEYAGRWFDEQFQKPKEGENVDRE